MLKSCSDDVLCNNIIFVED